MNHIKIWFYGSLFVTFAVLYLLITGHPLMTKSIGSNNLPLGTIITWLGMVSLPTSIYWGIHSLRTPIHRFHYVLSFLIKILIFLGLFWAPISYALAGNWSFTFAESTAFLGGQEAMRWFWRLSYGIGFGSLGVLVLYLISLIWNRR